MTRCLVTDRRRLCPEARTFAAARACLVEQARAAAAAVPANPFVTAAAGEAPAPAAESAKRARTTRSTTA